MRCRCGIFADCVAVVSDDRGETYDRRNHSWIRSNAVFCTGNDSGSDFENYFCAYFLTEIRKYRNMDGMAVWMARSYGADSFLLQESTAKDAG